MAETPRQPLHTPPCTNISNNPCTRNRKDHTLHTHVRSALLLSVDPSAHVELYSAPIWSASIFYFSSMAQLNYRSLFAAAAPPAQTYSQSQSQTYAQPVPPQTAQYAPAQWTQEAPNPQPSAIGSPPGRLSALYNFLQTAKSLSSAL